MVCVARLVDRMGHDLGLAGYWVEEEHRQVLAVHRAIAHRLETLHTVADLEKPWVCKVEMFALGVDEFAQAENPGGHTISVKLRYSHVPLVLWEHHRTWVSREMVGDGRVEIRV